uniref:Protein pelota homolog n=1 Tax=Hanusia phi TaxID=3032 RepID=A0A7S0H6V7_9CRYP|mmetsp:Transcript_13028/g.29966  ORF Transcript_13028/g.29966 Transcript_13028/m.29966 type:complete len:402 (+) Transcript_13028:106-1311(+)
MRLLQKAISKDGGRIKLIPDDAEDLWTVYNLISVGDSVRTDTFRKVASESSTGSVSTEKMRITLTIKVEAIDFDAQTPALRLKGKNIVENDFVKMGQYHTLELETQRPFSLAKSEWDSIASDLVEQACDVTRKADLAVVVMQEGLAFVCLITSSMTLTRQKIEVSIPRKQGAASMGREKALAKFYDQVMRAIMQHVDFSIVKCLIIASPGFVNEYLMRHIEMMSHKLDLRCLMDHKSKFLFCHCSSGHKHAIKEILSDPAIASRLHDTKAAAESRALNDFFKMLNNDADRTAYGEAHVMHAAQIGAINTLLISDNLFRSQDPGARKKYVDLVETVKDSGGVPLIFSTMHVSGERLQMLSGLAAILRFPVPGLEDIPADEDEDDNDEDFDLLAELLSPSKNN